MTTVACVLKLGGDFDRSWVFALRAGVCEFAPEHRFVCLTDDAQLNLAADYANPPIERVELRHGWPKWWSKLELFRPDVFDGDGPVLYMDLDTLPVGDLSDLMDYAGRMAMITDVYDAAKPAAKRRLQSGVMAWTPGPHTAAIWAEWTRDPPGHMKRYRGDGEFIAAQVPDADRLQDLYPGQIVSLKREAKKGPPETARLICGHGNPRLSKPAAGWAHDVWADAKEGLG